MNALVVFYSKTGHTKAVAERIARELGADIAHEVGADIEGIVEAGRRAGAVRAVLAALLGRKPHIAPLKRSPGDYDLVIIGTPVWGGGPAPAVCEFLSTAALDDVPVAWFCTFGGSGDEATFEMMQKIAPSARVLAQVALSHADRKNTAAAEKKISSFCSEIRNALV